MLGVFNIIVSYFLLTFILLFWNPFNNYYRVLEVQAIKNKIRFYFYVIYEFTSNIIDSFLTNRMKSKERIQKINKYVDKTWMIFAKGANKNI